MEIILGVKLWGNFELAGTWLLLFWLFVMSGILGDKDFLSAITLMVVFAGKVKIKPAAPSMALSAHG